jgi:hypothetical protein
MYPRTTRQMLIIGLTTVLAVLLAASCNFDEKGSLQLSFQLGSSSSCKTSDIDIKEVRAVLNDDEYEEVVDCEDGEIRFTDLPAGTYTLKLYGYDKVDADRNDTAAQISKPEEVTIKGEETTTLSEPITLRNAPAVLEVRWDFGFNDCKSLDFGGFFITATNFGGGTVYLEEEKVPCNLGGADRDGYRTIPDTDGRLDGEKFREVVIQPYDTNLADLGDEVKFEFSSPGFGGVVKLSLTCDKNGCEGSGEAD